MLARLLQLRFALLLGVGSLAVALPFPSSAWADDDDDEGDDDDDDDDDDDGGGDDDDEEEQPPVTSGGLFTKRTYPIAELERPLTVIGGMIEGRAGIDIDVGKATAFDIWRAKLDLRYGIKDFIEAQAGLSTVLAGELAMGSNLTTIYAGMESAIAYDLVDFRILVELPVDPEFKFDIAFGFPFRYKPKPNVAIIALDKIMTIHTDGADPDLTIGVGLIFQVVEKFAVLGRAEITIPQFNTDIIIIPGTVAFQFSPTNKFDLGGEFTLGNLKPPEGQKPWDQRSLLLYLQARL